MSFVNLATSFGFHFRPAGIPMPALILVIALSATNGHVQPAENVGKMFGRDLPVALETLPAGKLRTALGNLPGPARERALGWLRRFEFPVADVHFLRSDAAGGIFYEDPVQAESDGADPDTAATFDPGNLTVQDAFTLHSKPGAARTVYVDMDGHNLTGTVWNSGNAASLDLRPLDLDGNEAAFAQQELAIVAEIWKRVAEDFAPFDIDVTTEQPAVFAGDVGHVVVTRRTDGSDRTVYNCFCAGTAYVNVWGSTYYQPALVFIDNLYSAHQIAEAAAHELGHNLGLSHDGSPTQEYYGGHGSGALSWAPIMGVGYNANVIQWSRGDYAGATNSQDDLGIIHGYLPYRNDDHEDLDFAAATPLVRSGDTAVVATSPVIDPANADRNSEGVIEDRSDIDLFAFDMGSGPLSLTITPAWIDSFFNQNQAGMNLNIEATLYDGAGTMIDQDRSTSATDAHIEATVVAGRYVLAIKGAGHAGAADGFSDYGSLGRYYINGSLAAAGVEMAAPEAPSDVEALPEGENGIFLAWSDPISSPENNEAGYRVFRQYDGGPFSHLVTLPADAGAYRDNNLANGVYVYYLEAFNGAGVALSNTTQPETVSVMRIAHADGETAQVAKILVGSYLNTVVDTDKEILRERRRGPSTARISKLKHTWTVSNVEPGAVVTLEIDAKAPANKEGDDFTFAYALNGGTYKTIGTVSNGTGRTVLNAVLPTDAAGTLSIRVTDTDRTAGAMNGDKIYVYRIAITSSGTPDDAMPAMEIAAAADSVIVEEGSAMALSAWADDFEDGDLSVAVTWHSDRQGVIGNGRNIVVPALAVGVHELTASVTDSAGHTATDTLTVIVDPAMDISANRTDGHLDLI